MNKGNGMKILVICQYFYPEQFKINDICTQLVQEGNEVTVLTGLPNYPSGKVDRKYKWFKHRIEKFNRVQIIRCWLIGRGTGMVRLALNYVSFAISSSIKSLFLKRNFDIILVYQLSPITMALPAIILKKLSKKPLVLYCHDLWPDSIASAGITEKNKIYRILLKFSKWIYKNADEIFISSRLFNEYFINTIGISKPITYLPVYAESLFEERSITKRPVDTLNLVFAGNIGEMQSVETIIYAANELKNFKHIKWHIIGDGSSRRKCEELAKKLELKNVVFYGYRPLSEMPNFYGLADAFLVTLKANKTISYTLPNKVQSYMATAKPIIGAIDGETKMIIEESQCGICAPAEDYKALAHNILKFDENKDLQAIYGEKARKYYDEHFSKNVYMMRLNALLKKLISK